MVEKAEWLIRKDGYFYRPNYQGYTTHKHEAGRYTKAKAEQEASVEPWHMKAIHESEWPDDAVSLNYKDKDARIAALEAQLAERVKVKLLAWRDGDRISISNGGDFNYSATYCTNGRGVYFWSVHVNDRYLSKYETLDEAKAAAQADYERRILSALEATPSAPKVTELDEWEGEITNTSERVSADRNRQARITAAQEEGR